MNFMDVPRVLFQEESEKISGVRFDLFVHPPGHSGLWGMKTIGVPTRQPDFTGLSVYAIGFHEEKKFSWFGLWILNQRDTALAAGDAILIIEAADFGKSSWPDSKFDSGEIGFMLGAGIRVRHFAQMDFRCSMCGLIGKIFQRMHQLAQDCDYHDSETESDEKVA